MPTPAELDEQINQYAARQGTGLPVPADIPGTGSQVPGVARTGNSFSQIVTGAHGAEVAKLSAAYQAYAGRVSAAELALRASQADKTLTFEAGKTNQGKSLQELEMYNKAFLSEAHLIAQQLVSMLNNLRAGSSATLSVSA